MKTVNIKGSEYITVNERLKHFRAEGVFTNWAIEEQLVELNDKEGVFKVIIKDDAGNVMATAHAQEYRDSSYINKTSFLENGFTSALGRALGYLGIGIDTAIASAEEVTNAVTNQKEDNRPWLNEQQFHATLQGTAEQAQKVLNNFRMKKEYRTEISKIFKL
jgi:hypothetical protein